MPNRIRLCGDTHMHSSISDGKFAPDELISKCKTKGLDWIIITDHNKNAVGDKSYYSENLLVIPGAEYTGRNGHMNIFGSGLPEFDGTRPEKYEQYLSMSALAHSNGCTVSINHPFCSRFGWRMPLEDFPADCVEIEHVHASEQHDLHQLVGAADSRRQANRGSWRQRLSPRLRHIGYARFADNIRFCRIEQRKRYSICPAPRQLVYHELARRVEARSVIQRLRSGR